MRRDRNELSRLFPHARRRPNPFVVLGRWWFELAVAGAVGSAALLAVTLLGVVGATVLGVALLAAACAVLARVEPAREAARDLVHRLVVPHRARVGFVQGGVLTRGGKPPLIVRSRCRADQARLSLWLPAGIVAADIEAAGAVIAASCGAARVAVLADGLRQDRVLLVLARPRWGWPGR